MPWDDDADDEWDDGAAPLPPDDRLWRHPSELGTGDEPPPAPPTGAAPFTAPGPPARGRAWIGVAAALALVAATGVALLISSGNIRPHTADRIAVPTTAPLATTSTASPGGGPIGRSSGGATASTTRPVSDTSAHTGGATTTLPAVPVAAATRHSVVRLDGGPAPGTGLVVRPGAVLTSVAVSGSAGTLVVRSDVMAPTVGTVLATDPVSGLAVVAVDTGDLPSAEFSTRQAGAGQDLAALGCSGDATPTVTTARVAATGSDGPPLGSQLHGLLRTTQGLAPATTGGPLVAGDGTVAGITVATDTSAAYAVPASMAHTVADDLIDRGRAQHAWLGVRAVDLDAATAERIHAQGGAVVRWVAPDGPAAAAGVVVGDIVLAVDRQAVRSADDLARQVEAASPGDVLELTVVHDDRTERRAVAVTEHTA